MQKLKRRFKDTPLDILAILRLCLPLVILNGCLVKPNIYRDIKQQYSYRPNSHRAEVLISKSDYLLYSIGDEFCMYLGGKNDSMFVENCEKIDNKVFKLNRISNDSNYLLTILNTNVFNQFHEAYMVVNGSTFKLTGQNKKTLEFKLNNSDSLYAEFVCIKRLSYTVLDTVYSKFRCVKNIRGAHYHINANNLVLLAGYRSSNNISNRKFNLSGPFNDTLYIEGVGKFYKDNSENYVSDVFKEFRRIKRAF